MTSLLTRHGNVRRDRCSGFSAVIATPARRCLGIKANVAIVSAATDFARSRDVRFYPERPPRDARSPRKYFNSCEGHKQTGHNIRPMTTIDKIVALNGKCELMRMRCDLTAAHALAAFAARFGRKWSPRVNRVIFAAGLDFRFTPEGGHAAAPGSKKRDGVAFGLANSFGQAYTPSITGR